jgi:hypothetical protein
MPTQVCRPNGPGDFTTWTPRNASGPPLANWQSVSSGSPNQWLECSDSDKRDRYTIEPLTAAASGVDLVSVFALCAGSGLTAMRLVARLGGLDAGGPLFEPLEGGYQLFFAQFLTAPGGLPWSVARFNALQIGIDATQSSDFVPLNVDEIWAEPVYLDAVVTDTVERALVIAPGGARARIAAPAARRRIVSPAGGRTSIRLAPERD